MVVLGSLLLAAPLHAQGAPASRLGPTQPARAQALGVPSRTLARLAPERSYWAVGGIIGGVLGLMLGWSIYDAPCETGRCDRQVTWVFIPTLGFGVIGALIGGAFKKHP